MNKYTDPLPKQVSFSKNEKFIEKVPWKLGRHVKADHAKVLDKLVLEYNQQMITQLKMNMKN